MEFLFVMLAFTGFIGFAALGGWILASYDNLLLTLACVICAMGCIVGFSMLATGGH